MANVSLISNSLFRLALKPDQKITIIVIIKFHQFSRLHWVHEKLLNYFRTPFNNFTTFVNINYSLVEIWFIYESQNTFCPSEDLHKYAFK